MKFDFLGPRDYINQFLRSRFSIIRSNKVAYDFIDGELVLGRYTVFCRITSALSKNFKSSWGLDTLEWLEELMLVYSGAFGVKS